MNYQNVTKKKSSEQVIVFSSINCPEGQFRFYRAFMEQERSVLFLNCKNNSWYLEGVPSLGNDLSSTLNAISKILLENNFSRISTFGSSMGGYGAILYGAMLGVHSIYAGCPELELGIKGGFYNRYNSDKPNNPIFDAVKMFNGYLNIFVAEESYVDLVQLECLERSELCNVNVIPNDFHGVLESIDSSIGISALLSCVDMFGKPVVINTVTGNELLSKSKVLYRAFEMIREDDIEPEVIAILEDLALSSSCSYLKSHCYFLMSVISMHLDSGSDAVRYSERSIHYRNCSFPSAKMISHYLRVVLKYGKKEKVAGVVPSLSMLKKTSSVKYFEGARSLKLKESLALLRKASFEFDIPFLRSEFII